uniref:CCHC-type domain-containing protein n=2 Tax=Lygus hesperus TaxID=30085 RepID=A0A146LQ89_LYGHE
MPRGGQRVPGDVSSDEDNTSQQGQENEAAQLNARALLAYDDVMERLQHLVLGLDRQRRANNENSNSVPVPKDIRDAIEPWEPSMSSKLSLHHFFSMFEEFTDNLDPTAKIKLLQTKLKGEARKFVLDNSEFRNARNPYQALKQSMLKWFERQEPDDLMRLLWAAKKEDGEDYREYAERVRGLAQRALDRPGQSPNPQEVEEKAVKAFTYGLPGTLKPLMISSLPKTLSEALRKAELLQSSIPTTEEVGWNIAAIADVQCYNCKEKGHFSSQCPHARRSTPRRIPPRPNGETPPRACHFCQSRSHYSAACPRKPAPPPGCNFCGSDFHEEKGCPERRRYRIEIAEESPSATSTSTRRPDSIGAINILSDDTPPEEPGEDKENEPTPAAEDIPWVRVLFQSPPCPAHEGCDPLTVKMTLHFSGVPTIMVIDTGSAISCLPQPDPRFPTETSGICLRGVDGAIFHVNQQQYLLVESSGRSFIHPFLIIASPSRYGIIGMDLLTRIPFYLYNHLPNALPDTPRHVMPAIEDPASLTITEPPDSTAPSAVRIRVMVHQPYEPLSTTDEPAMKAPLFSDYEDSGRKETIRDNAALHDIRYLELTQHHHMDTSEEEDTRDEEQAAPMDQDESSSMLNEEKQQHRDSPDNDDKSSGHDVPPSEDQDICEVGSGPSPSASTTDPPLLVEEDDYSPLQRQPTIHLADRLDPESWSRCRCPRCRRLRSPPNGSRRGHSWFHHPSTSRAQTFTPREELHPHEIWLQCPYYGVTMIEAPAEPTMHTSIPVEVMSHPQDILATSERFAAINKINETIELIRISYRNSRERHLYQAHRELKALRRFLRKDLFGTQDSDTDEELPHTTPGRTTSSANSNPRPSPTPKRRWRRKGRNGTAKGTQPQNSNVEQPSRPPRQSSV